jgi:hypothetical protein
MKNLPTYNQWLSENEVNEFLKTDVRKVHHFLIELGKKIKDSRVVSDIKQAVAMMEIDPYMTYKGIMDRLADTYKNNREVMQVVSKHVDEFEGSYGGSTQLASDLFLATQTAANGIAF